MVGFANPSLTGSWDQGLGIPKLETCCRQLLFCVAIFSAVSVSVSASLSLVVEVMVEERGPAPAAADAVVAGPQEQQEQHSPRRSRRRRASHADHDFEHGGQSGCTSSSSRKHQDVAYECRFCLMKFEKSQALGGHMNRHRQEREREQLQHAQSLVSSANQQQMPRAWTTLAAEITQQQNPMGPGGTLSRLGSLTPGTPRQLLVPPPISFSSYRGPTPAPSEAGQISSPPYYSMHPSQQQQQLNWSMDGFGNAGVSRTASQTGSFHPGESMATLQGAGVCAPSEFLANMLRSSANANDSSNSLVSSTTAPTSSAPSPYDFYQQPHPSSYLNGGM